MPFICFSGNFPPDLLHEHLLLEENFVSWCSYNLVFYWNIYKPSHDICFKGLRVNGTLYTACQLSLLLTGFFYRQMITVVHYKSIILQLKIEVILTEKIGTSLTLLAPYFAISNPLRRSFCAAGLYFRSSPSLGLPTLVQHLSRYLSIPQAFYTDSYSPSLSTLMKMMIQSLMLDFKQNHNKNCTSTS